MDDPLQHQAHADLIVQRAADQLRNLLHNLALQIRPFPEFPGSFFSYGIEVEADDSAGRGCIVLGEDGELYELLIGLDVAEVATGDPAAMRSEERILLEDLPPATYVSLAHRAVTAAVEYLLAHPEATPDA
ncbi:MAG: hypothetical protein K1X87_04925 [Dehalococcoidia bacterium]|nr:hypothetical protein [Dehalococcoidia bacterium]